MMKLQQYDSKKDASASGGIAHATSSVALGKGAAVKPVGGGKEGGGGGGAKKLKSLDKVALEAAVSESEGDAVDPEKAAAEGEPVLHLR
jgi:hypothetical protein